MKFGRKKKEVRSAPEWMVKAVIRERVFRRRIADKLRAWTVRLSPVRLRWYAFVFILAGSLAYTWILVTAITGRGRKPDIQVITVPVTAGRLAPGAMNAVRPPFRRWLDSVNADPVLKRSFDSLRAVRPGFADTIRQLEELNPEH